MSKIIVVGGLNTDIIARGVDKLLGVGELTRSGELVVGPGGKSRNIAQMIALYSDLHTVHMIGKTARDPYGLWEVPYQALQDAGVNVDAVEIVEGTGMMPGIALIPVDKEGRNQIYCLPGINDSLSEKDIVRAQRCFAESGGEGGVLALSFEMPVSAAVGAVRMAARHGVKTVVDPGGITSREEYEEVFREDIYLLKPNEHEIAILTGMEVTDQKSAEEAGRFMMKNYPVRNVLITRGSKGSYLITPEEATHLPVVDLKATGDSDETGCGDQVTAVMASEIAFGTPLSEAARIAMIAGGLQFRRIGIQPVVKTDVTNFAD